MEGAALVLQQRLFSLAFFFLLFFVRECFLFSVWVLPFQSKKMKRNLLLQDVHTLVAPETLQSAFTRVASLAVPSPHSVFGLFLFFETLSRIGKSGKFSEYLSNSRI